MRSEDGYAKSLNKKRKALKTLLDHHCPWINNCVGHFNYGHFIRFLFFVDVACSYHCAMVTKRVLYSMNGTFWVRLLLLSKLFVRLDLCKR
jgi:hypothetical protein